MTATPTLSATPTATATRVFQTVKLVQYASNSNSGGSSVNIYYNSECTGANAPYQRCTGAGTGAGLSSTPANGDCMIISVASRNGVSVTPPSGWTSGGTCPNASGTNASLCDFTKIANSESGDYTFTFGTTAYPNASFIEFHGANQSQCLDPAVRAEAGDPGGGVTSITYGTPSVANEELNTLTVSCNAIFTTPSDVTQLVNLTQINGDWFGMYLG